MGYKLAWEPRGVVIRFFGQISINDLKKATIEYGSDARFDNLLHVIADYSQIAGCITRPADIEDIWAQDTGAKFSNPKIKKAIVTTSPEVIKLATYYKKELGSAFPVEIFTTEVDARAWLNSNAVI